MPELIDNRYLIHDVAGAGGMATVFRAYDKRLERYVAIKIINTDQFSPVTLEEYFLRFDREAKVLAKFAHSNIYNILDYGKHEGSPYIVMHYLSGGSLKQRLKQKGHPFSWQEAFNILLPIMRGLAYAHRQGIIHRDINPSNILFDESGEPVLSDFGIAKSLLTKDSFLTKSGTLVGTPAYMSPEQGMGAKLDARSDIYTIGIVLFEMITGHLPYEPRMEAPLAVLSDKRSGPPPDPREFIPDLPKDVVDILFKALSLQLEDRFQNIEDFSLAMENILKGKISSAGDEDQRTYPWTWLKNAFFQKKRLVIIIIVALVLTTFMALGGSFLPLTPSPTPTATSTATLTPTSTATSNPTPNLNLPVETILPLGITMRLVQAGEFTMGSNAGEAYIECQKHRTDCVQNRFIDEESPKTVFIGDFYIDQHEVTNALYKRCVDAGACQPPQDSSSNTRSNYYGNPEFDDYPVIYVTWNMAKTFCEWSGARLPTEAEWEKAARGTDGRTYPWGDELDCDHANYGQSADGTCVGDTTSIGSYESGQSVYGLYDMAGNVDEWVNSLYQPYPYSADDGREDLLDASGVRVIRGGSWDYTTGDVRSANRNGFSSTTATNSIGFRCAQDPQ